MAVAIGTTILTSVGVGADVAATTIGSLVGISSISFTVAGVVGFVAESAVALGIGMLTAPSIGRANPAQASQATALEQYVVRQPVPARKKFYGRIGRGGYL